jgi:hypothetical protein
MRGLPRRSRLHRGPRQLRNQRRRRNAIAAPVRDRPHVDRVASPGRDCSRVRSVAPAGGAYTARRSAYRPPTPTSRCKSRARLRPRDPRRPCYCRWDLSRCFYARRANEWASSARSFSCAKNPVTTGTRTTPRSACTRHRAETLRMTAPPPCPRPVGGVPSHCPDRSPARIGSKPFGRASSRMHRAIAPCGLAPEGIGRLRFRASDPAGRGDDGRPQRRHRSGHPRV